MGFPFDPVGAGLVYNVRSYGAFGDGVHDDTAAWQAALNAAAASRGGTVFAPVGIYLISQPLSILGDGVYIVGDGIGWEQGVPGQVGYSGAVIEAASSFPTGKRIISWQDPSSTQLYSGGGIAHISIDCQGVADGVYGFNTYHWIAYDDYVANAWSSGIYGACPKGGTTTADSMLIEACKVFQTYGNATTIGGVATTPCGIGIADAMFHSAIAHCYSQQTTGEAYLLGSPINQSFFLTIDSCVADTPSGSAFRFESTQDCSLVNSKLYGSAGQNALNLNGGHRAIVIGNRFGPSNSGNNQSTAAAAMVSLSQDGSIISGNYFYPGSYTSVLVYDNITAGEAPAIVEANIFEAAGTAGYVTGPSGHISIFRNNQGYNPVGSSVPGTAFALPASGTAWTNNTGVDGTLFVTGAGVVTDVVVQGVTVASSLSVGQSYFVPAGGTITFTYTTAPTLVFVGN